MAPNKVPNVLAPIFTPGCYNMTNTQGRNSNVKAHNVATDAIKEGQIPEVSAMAHNTHASQMNPINLLNQTVNEKEVIGGMASLKFDTQNLADGRKATPDIPATVSQDIETATTAASTAARYYEAGSAALDNSDSVLQGPLIVVPRAQSQPHELRANIYKIVSMSNMLQATLRAAAGPTAPVASTSYASSASRTKSMATLSTDLREVVVLVQDLAAQTETYRTVIQKIQPKVMDFARSLRNAALALEYNDQNPIQLQIVTQLALEINVILKHHRLMEKAEYARKWTSQNMPSRYFHRPG